jgi:hypothetical protein
VRWASSAVQIEAIGELFGLLGHHVLYAAIVLVVGMGILQAVKGAGSYVAVVAGAVAAVALAVLQYTARRSCGALHRTSGTAGAALASRTVPDCFALLAALGGLLVLAGAVVGAVEAAQYTPVLYGLAGLAVCAYAALVALNPEALGVAIAPEAGAAEEAVGVMALMLKIAARVVPVAYGAGVVCATLILIYAYFQVFSAAGAAAGAITAGTATVQFFVFAGLPLAGYLAFLLGCLLIELARAVLRVPGKLDALGRPTEAPPAAGPEAPPAAQRPAEKPQPPQ